MSIPEMGGAESGLVVRSTDLGLRDDACVRDPFCFALLVWMKRFDGLADGALIGALVWVTGSVTDLC